MTVDGWLQILFLAAVLTVLTPLLGGYMARVYQGQRVALTTVLGPVEQLMYRLLRTDLADEQDWKGYARAVVLFSAGSWFVLYVVLRT
jgi:potassium-transporting ATPase potassium-binding subunit